MGGFDGQLRARKENDEALLEHAFANISDAVSGSRTADRFKTSAEKAKTAIDEILLYYRVGTREVPKEIQDLNEQIEYLMRPHSIMHKDVVLEKGWYRDSIGALLGTRKSDGRVVALLPKGMFGYVYRDELTGKPIRVTARNQDQFDAQAIAFYRVFPLTKINIPTLLRYIVRTIDRADYIMFGILTLIVVLIGLLMPRLNNLLVGLVAESASRKLLVSMSAFMACVSVSSLMFGAAKSLMMSRIKLRMNLSVQAATMARILALPASFFKNYSSGELSSRASQVSKLCEMLASALLSTGLTSVFSLIYIGQIFLYAPTLVQPALAIVLITVLFSLVTTLLQMKVCQRTMEVAAKENGMGYALLKGIQKIRLSGAETRAFTRWMQVYSDKVRLTYHPPFLVKFNATIALLISLAGTIVMYEAAFVSGISVADYYAFNTAYGMVSGAFLSLASIALLLSGCRPTLEMVRPFFDAEPEASEDKQIITSLDGSIELDNVCFRYDENMPNVLDNLTLKIEPGQYVAIVGSTGCGKSTLMRLMLGFEKPDKGAIYYDGRDLNTIGYEITAPEDRRRDAKRQAVPGRYLFQYRDIRAVAECRRRLERCGDRGHRRGYKPYANGHVYARRRDGRHFRRTEAAAHDRARDRGQPPGADVRRGNQRAGQHRAEKDFRRVEQSQVYPYRNRAPAVHDQTVRQDRRAGSREDHRGRHL